MDQQPNTEAPQWAVPLDCRVRAQFEAWITSPPYEKSTETKSTKWFPPGQYRDIGTAIAWEAWQAAIKAERESLVITTTRAGECVLVSRQDEDGRILSVIWESEGPYGAHEDLRSNVEVRG